LTCHENTKISTLIDPDTIYVVTDDDQERVRNVFSKNDLIVVPVLDEDHKLVGRITADRVIEVAEEEAAEDLYIMAGTDADELDTFSAFRAARIRMTWLLPCLLGTAVTAMVLMFFKHHAPLVYVVAVAFVPMIAAISGNAGLQTSAIVVSGVIGGIACAVLLNMRMPESSIEPFRIIFAFGIAMFSAIMVATTLGLFLPFLFRRIGIDPAISSGPLVTTANDSISVAIYMTLVLMLV